MCAYISYPYLARFVIPIDRSYHVYGNNCPITHVNGFSQMCQKIEFWALPLILSGCKHSQRFSPHIHLKVVFHLQQNERSRCTNTFGWMPCSSVPFSFLPTTDIRASKITGRLLCSHVWLSSLSALAWSTMKRCDGFEALKCWQVCYKQTGLPCPILQFLEHLSSLWSRVSWSQT